MSRSMILTIGVLAVGWRLAFAMWSGRLWSPELWEQEQIATNLLQGQGFVMDAWNTIYRSYCEPLYPFLAAGVYALTRHSHSALVMVQAIIASLTAVVAAACAWRVTQRRQVAWIAGFLVALHPGLIVYTTKLHPLVLDALFFTLVGWATLRYADRPTGTGVVLLGVLVGLCTLTRPTVLVLLPLIGWWVWQTTGRVMKDRIRRVGLLLGVAVLIVSPWVIRNYRLHRQFILTRSLAPYAFWLGNNPQASGAALDPRGEAVFNLAPRAFQEAVLVSDELGQNRLFTEAAWTYIRSDPWAFVKRTWQKFTYFWWFSPSAGQLYPARWFALYQLWWAGWLLLGLLGIARVNTLPGQLRTRLWAVVGMVLLIGVAQSVFYVEGRHRLAIEPLLSSLIALGIFRIK